MATWDKASFDKFYSFKGEPYGRPATRPGIRVHYNDFVVGKGQRSLAKNLISAAGIPVGANVVVIGAGFGWTVEGLIENGINAVGTDISAYILAEKGNSEEADLRGYIQEAGVDPDLDWIICSPHHPNAVWMEDPHKIHSQTGQSVTGLFEFMCRPLELLMTRTGARSQSLVMDEDSSSNTSRKRIGRQFESKIDYILTEEVLNGLTDEEGLVLCDVVSNLASGHSAKIIHILSPAIKLNVKSYPNWSFHLDFNGFGEHAIIPSVTSDNIKAYSGVL